MTENAMSLWAEIQQQTQSEDFQIKSNQTDFMEQKLMNFASVLFLEP